MKKILMLAAVIIASISTAAFAANYNVGDLVITSSYNHTTSNYYYTDATAHATYAISKVSLGSNGYTEYKTTLKKSTLGIYTSVGTKTTKLTKANMSVRLTWQDIAEGNYKYQTKGSAGTTYASLTVGSY